MDFGQLWAFIPTHPCEICRRHPAEEGDFLLQFASRGLRILEATTIHASPEEISFFFFFKKNSSSAASPHRRPRPDHRRPARSGELPIRMAVLLRTTTSATTATSGGSSSATALLATTFRRGGRRLLLLPATRGSAPRRAALLTARASAEPLEVCAKASLTVPDRLGDCEPSPYPSLCVNARWMNFFFERTALDEFSNELPPYFNV